MLLPILFLFKTKISDYFKYSFFIRHGNMSFFNGFLLVTINFYFNLLKPLIYKGFLKR